MMHDMPSEGQPVTQEAFRAALDFITNALRDEMTPHAFRQVIDDQMRSLQAVRMMPEEFRADSLWLQAWAHEPVLSWFEAWLITQQSAWSRDV